MKRDGITILHGIHDLHLPQCSEVLLHITRREKLLTVLSLKLCAFIVQACCIEILLSFQVEILVLAIFK